MSEIARFFSWDGDGMRPANNGDYVRYDDHLAEVKRVARQNSENFAEAECLKNAIDHLTDHLMSERDEAQDEVKRLKEQVAALTVAVEQADEMKAHAKAAAAAEEAETDRVMAERDAAQAEVERLRANGQAILDSSRPTDEDIWREAFMAAVRSRDFHRTKMADEVLAEYRKRWPR